jgi:hypothetical protein
MTQPENSVSPERAKPVLSNLPVLPILPDLPVWPILPVLPILNEKFQFCFKLFANNRKNGQKHIISA